MSEVIPEEDNLIEPKHSAVELAPAAAALAITTPLDLRPLEMLDSLYIKQKFDRRELWGAKVKNRYFVKKSKENPLTIYQIKEEESGCCMRYCIGKRRCFNAIIDDYNGHYVHLHRSMSCNLCLCCPPCLSTLTVTSSSGELYGTIRQTWSICIARLIVENGQGERILVIKGPCCTFGGICGDDVEFRIKSKSSGEQIGMISKKWAGLVRETISDADNFAITFPLDLDVKMKMVLLAASILIDFLFFDSTSKSAAIGLSRGVSHAGVSVAGP